MKVLRLKGTDKILYNLVAPLVMDAEVLKQNNGYPFKTSEAHTWYVAINGKEKVLGFIPFVVKKEKTIYIDNYYIQKDDFQISEMLLDRLVNDFCQEYIITALVHKRHVEHFKRNHFIPTKNWKNYETMEYVSSTQEDSRS